MARVHLTWHDADLQRRVFAAAKSGVDQVDAAVAEASRHDHPGWHNVTGEAERSITAIPATTTPTGLEAAVGFGIARGRFLELTTRRHPGDRTVTRAFERLSRELSSRIGAAFRA
jgi:hypothetical protein